MNTTSALFKNWRAVPTGILCMTLLMLANQSLWAAQTTTATANGYLVDVPVPGILCTNASGQVYLKGNVHRLRMQADDARLTGRFQAIMDRGYLIDGTSHFGGSAYLEVGAWDLVDPLNPKFKPNRGVWDILYQGVTQVDGSHLIHMKGYGIGGVIEGQVLEETVTRGPGEPFDPSVPYLATATIRLAPQDTIQVVDNFDDNKLTRWEAWSSTLSESDRQLTVRGYWPEPPLKVPEFRFAKGLISRGWAIADGKTLEYRVDLVQVGDDVSIVKPDIWSQARGLGYDIAVGTNFVAIMKWLPDFAVFHCERAIIPRTNVTLALAMTRVRTNLVLTARILDAGNLGTVLYQHALVDTPLADPTLSPAQFRALTGMDAPIISDQPGAPLFAGDSLDLEILQYTDGTRPAAVVIFDNVELRTSDNPLVAIEQAVRLSWPASNSLNFAAEGAPNLQGPWLPIKDSTAPSLTQMTISAKDSMRYFRLRSAP